MRATALSLWPRGLLSSVRLARPRDRGRSARIAWSDARADSPQGFGGGFPTPGGGFPPRIDHLLPFRPPPKVTSDVSAWPVRPWPAGRCCPPERWRPR